MTTSGSVFEKPYDININLINTNRKLGLIGLLNILQDTAADHAENLGFGYDNSKEMGFFWVLVRLSLRMDTWPDWNDQVIVKTWTRPVYGVTGVREFEIEVNNKKIGACSTLWMILDCNTRRPKLIKKSDDLFKPRTDYSLDFTAEKLQIPDNMEQRKSFEVRISDLDMNQHVNNVKYAQWMLDSVPFDYHQRFIIKSYEINFMNESFLNDEIVVHSSFNPLEQSNKYQVDFKGDRTHDSKTIFAAQLTTEDVK